MLRVDFCQKSTGWESTVSASQFSTGKNLSPPDSKKSTYLANAKVIRLDVVMILIVAKSRHTSGNLEPKHQQTLENWQVNVGTYMSRHIEPALLPVAW